VDFRNNLRVGKGPVGTHKRTDEVRARDCEDVVDGISGGNDTFASTRRGTASLPGYDVAGLFIMEVLHMHVSTYTTLQMQADLLKSLQS
jgi:hypothetical protein